MTYHAYKLLTSSSMGEGVEGEVGGGCGAIDLISASGKRVYTNICVHNKVL